MSTPSIASPVTTPSGLIIPGSVPVASPDLMPASAPPVTQTSSGLWVPSQKLEVPTSGGLIIAKSADSDALRDAARGAYNDAAKQYGAGVADALHGSQVGIAETAHADIEHDRIIDALKKGNVAAAIEVAKK